MAQKVFLDERKVLSGEVNFPLIFQRESLGLDDKAVAELRANKSKVLDIGCGSEARLVHYLRSMGVDAEGIDIFPSTQPYILTHPLFPSPIPRGNERYNLVVAHALDAFDHGLTKYGQVQKTIERMAGISTMPLYDPKEVAQFILTESIRVLKQGGQLITRPALDITVLQGCEISVEDIERTAFKEEGFAMFEPLINILQLPRDFFRFMEQRKKVLKL